MAIGTTIEVNNFQREHLQNTQKRVFDNSAPDISAIKNLVPFENGTFIA